MNKNNENDTPKFTKDELDELMAGAPEIEPQDLMPDIDLDDLTPEIDFAALQAPAIDLEALTPVSSILDAAVRAAVNGDETEIDGLVAAIVHNLTPDQAKVVATLDRADELQADDPLLSRREAVIAARADVEEEDEEMSAAQAGAIIAQADYLQDHTRYLKRADALRLAEEAVNRDVERGRIDDRWADRPLATTLSDARRLVRGQRIEKHAPVLEAIYESTCAQLVEAGLDFGVLMAWNNGERGQ